MSPLGLCFSEKSYAGRARSSSSSTSSGARHRSERRSLGRSAGILPAPIHRGLARCEAVKKTAVAAPIFSQLHSGQDARAPSAFHFYVAHPEKTLVLPRLTHLFYNEEV